MKVINCTVESIEELTNVVHKVILVPEIPLVFKAGQYLQVVMGESDKRPFSIANAPSAPGKIELHIGAEPENPYAYEVLTTCQNEGKLVIEAPLGKAFVRESNKPAIIVAGGTGYSYAKSIVLDCLEQQAGREITLYWGAKSFADLYEAKDLEALSLTHPNFTFVPVVELPSEQWQGHVGWVHKAVLKDITDWSGKQVYAAGRFEMSATIRDEFCAAGLDKEELFGDAYAFI
ncbi:NAD(P)H-flavin reductase [Glaciecola sp.]|jgi:aquacobalamin reductase/NAD(P)H-flavin reductase|uniref:NAD(P)H-flavin reductase n=1 Tax=Glaciecola sp. MF2-115 TaxID=3384827 RepID=UPI0039890555